MRVVSIILKLIEAAGAHWNLTLLARCGVGGEDVRAEAARDCI